ncbi:hypothetical protein J2I47_02815 [Fibrella sp. HMF5335]|uniref:Uncharacterized protein n=1 Tax=Fibrella rubiginis TaxID=2817060 RepID=A0A939K3T7_9BACT|nr:hypothetical protein [Fibrella rubiginis]MBO0935471.1 hypothetical protein [Fibrella rubiginis]
MRSQFLTILCVLSFLSCGWGLAESGIALFNPDRVAQTPYTGHKDTGAGEEDRLDPKNFYQDNSANSDNPTPADPGLVRRQSLAQFVYSLVTLIGVILMFRLRRTGFYVYLAGVLLGIIMPIYFVGFAALITSFGVFGSVLFAVMYGFCLREMK